MREELWSIIPEFPDYQVSSLGRIFNRKNETIVKTTFTNHGHPKVSLYYPFTLGRKTRSLSKLVAEAFVEQPNILCDEVIVLDGNYANIVAENLAWRPTSFAWKYVRQLKEPQPAHYRNLRVNNISVMRAYDSIIEAGMTEGLLFEDIWMSTYNGKPVFPYGHQFDVVDRV
jgi:hypothetical protein